MSPRIALLFALLAPLPATGLQITFNHEIANPVVGQPFELEVIVDPEGVTFSTVFGRLSWICNWAEGLSVEQDPLDTDWTLVPLTIDNVAAHVINYADLFNQSSPNPDTGLLIARAVLIIEEPHGVSFGAEVSLDGHTWEDNPGGNYTRAVSTTIYPAAIPEPTTAALVGLGLLALARGRRGRRFQIP